MEVCRVGAKAKGRVGPRNKLTYNFIYTFSPSRLGEPRSSYRAKTMRQGFRLWLIAEATHKIILILVLKNPCLVKIKIG